MRYSVGLNHSSNQLRAREFASLGKKCIKVYVDLG